MRAKTPEYRSSVAIIELVDGRVKVKLPKTVDGYAIGRRLAELLAGKNGVAILHRKEPREREWESVRMDELGALHPKKEAKT